MGAYAHCDFRHLLEWRGSAEYRHLSHVHEDEALSCAFYQHMGWPRKDGL